MLFRTHGEGVRSQSEKVLAKNIEKKEIFRKRNVLLTVMELLNICQKSDEQLLSFLPWLQAEACQCELAARCEYGKSVDYTDQIIFYMLVAGLKDIETKEDLLSLDDLNLETAATKAVAEEAAMFSQSEMSSEKNASLVECHSDNKF